MESPRSLSARLNSSPWLAILLFGVLLLVYWPALGGSILWNDADYITQPRLQSMHGLWQIWFDVGSTEQYYPLLHTAFWLEHRVWGDAMLGYHLINLLLHGVCAVLLALNLRRLALPGAWLAAFVFAVHPVCVESVAWVTEQKNTLSTAFFLAAGLAYLRFDQTRTKRSYWLALALFVCALFSKSLTATLAPALLVIFWWQRGRLEWRRDVVPLLPWFAAGAAVGLFTAWVEHTYIGATGEDFNLTLMERCLLAGRTTWFYIGKVFWPTDLVFIYPRWQISAAEIQQFLFPVSLLALIAALWAVRHRWRGPLAAMLFFVGTLFPVMGFLNVFAFYFSFVADHWQYLPMVGLVAAGSAGVALAIDKLKLRSPWTGRAIMAVLVGTLGILSWREAGHYRDVVGFYRNILSRNPDAFMIRNNLAVELSAQPGQQAEMFEHYRAALRIKPDYAQAMINMATEIAKLPNQKAKAIALTEKVLETHPYNAQAHHNLGFYLLDSPNQLARCVSELETAVRQNPNYAKAHNTLGIALRRIPARRAEGLTHYRKAVQLMPSFADARFNLAIALSTEPGAEAEAIAQFQALLQLQPNDAEAHNKLGEVLLRTGRVGEARTHFETAVRLNPNYRPARDNLAKLAAPPTKP